MEWVVEEDSYGHVTSDRNEDCNCRTVSLFCREYVCFRVCIISLTLRCISYQGVISLYLSTVNFTS